MAYTLLKRGSKGDGVRRLQLALNEAGYNCGVADGDYGTKTENAVRNYQADHGLTVDGIAGNATQTHLYETRNKLTDAELGKLFRECLDAVDKLPELDKLVGAMLK